MKFYYKMTTILQLLMMLVFVATMAIADSAKDINEAALKRSMDVAHQMKEAKINELKVSEKRLKDEEKEDDAILKKRFSDHGGDVLQIVAKQAYEIADLKRTIGKMEKMDEKIKRERKGMKNTIGKMEKMDEETKRERKDMKNTIAELKRKMEKTDEETTKIISQLQQEMKKLKASRQKLQPRQEAEPLVPLEQWIDSTDIELKDLSKRVSKLEGTAENCFVFVAGKNWTLIQRRRSITKNPWSEAKWHDYKIGFGNPAAENFWLGLEKMHNMTSKGKWQLMMRMKLSSGPHTGQMGYAIWDGFKIGPEKDLYKLTVGPRIEIVNIDSPYDYLTFQNGKQFTTSDKGPKGSESCPPTYFGGWWYYYNSGCFHVCLNCYWNKNSDGEGFCMWDTNVAYQCSTTTEIGIREHN